MTEKDFFFAYNPHVAKFLRYDKGIEFITKAKHPLTNKLFFLFFKTPELQDALKEYQKIN